MPILYPSQSPISTLRLSQILPLRPSRAGQVMYGIIPIILTIIAVEASIIFNYSLVEEFPIVTIIVLLGTVVFTSSRYGSYSGIIGGIIASFYLGYIFSIPGQPYNFEGETGRNVMLVSSLFIGLAIATGYLRERIEQALLQEQLARALAEEQQLRLETILDHLPISVVISDAKTKQIVYHNQFSQSLIHDLPDASHQTLHQTLQQILDISLSSKEENREFQFQKTNGQTVMIQSNSSPIYDLAGRHVSTVTTLIDVTQQKEVEQRKDDFISIASHELKTPVTSLKIYLQLLSRQNIVKASSELTDIVTKANNQINRLSHLMSDLLDVNQIQTGKSEYRFQSININAIVRETVSSLKSSTHHKITIKGKADDAVWADPEKIGQVITNLLNNAFKYSKDASQVIVHLSQNKSSTIVSVQDFGIGIDIKQQKKIFERFYQVRQSDSKSFPGLGIGLYICQKIIGDHGGEIWVESQLGQGSTFSFSLPHSTN